MIVAIAVAILLPPAARVIVDRLNTAFYATSGRGFRFDAEHHPHITLGQHFVTEDGMPAVWNRIGQVVPRFGPFEVQITGSRGGRTAQVLVVERSDELQQLHARVMHTMQACEVAGGDSSAFYESGEPARPADAAWVARFRANSSFTRFAPHITIGIGPRQLSVDPFQFTARELAVCHLGRYCTCRDRLATWTL